MNISVATYSLRDSIKQIGMAGVADYLNKIGVKFVEINNMFTTAQKLPDDVKLFASKGIKTVLLTYDGNNFFMPADDDAAEDRQDQFDQMKPWIDAAKATGIPMIRANMGHPLGIIKKEAKMLKDLVATFKPIQEYAEKLGISLVFENHGGPSSEVDFQLKVKKVFPSDKMGYLLDTGNYKPKDLVYENIGKLGKAIKIVHAKTYDFDAKGEETQLDFKRIITALKAVGFAGFFSIEFEGKLEAKEGVEKTLALLKKYLA
jgi:L-ribulose-5-phosphate 3-epimerase